MSELSRRMTKRKEWMDQFENPAPCPETGYAGFSHLPSSVQRKYVKKGFEFTLMIVGDSGLGKSTLVNSLFLSDLYRDQQEDLDVSEKLERSVEIQPSTVEIEEKGVKLKVTIIDTPGYGDALDCTDCFRPIAKYIDDQFESYLQAESGLDRRNISDTRVHCCLYFISPYGRGLKPLDVLFMKKLHNKVNIVPIIAKSDVLTIKERMKLKKRIMAEIEQNGINIYSLPDCDVDDDKEYQEQVIQLKEAVPFAVSSSTKFVELNGQKVRALKFPWGIVEIENPLHCDFSKLRTMLITHMQDLKDVTQDVHYEEYRSVHLSKTTNGHSAMTNGDGRKMPH